jgi:hypothetical protein
MAKGRIRRFVRRWFHRLRHPRSHEKALKSTHDKLDKILSAIEQQQFHSQLQPLWNTAVPDAVAVSTSPCPPPDYSTPTCTPSCAPLPYNLALPESNSAHISPLHSTNLDSKPTSYSLNDPSYKIQLATFFTEILHNLDLLQWEPFELEILLHHLKPYLGRIDQTNSSPNTVAELIKRFDTMDTSLSSLHDKADSTNSKADRISKKANSITKKTDSINNKADLINKKTDLINHKMDSIQAQAASFQMNASIQFHRLIAQLKKLVELCEKVDENLAQMKGQRLHTTIKASLRPQFGVSGEIRNEVEKRYISECWWRGIDPEDDDYDDEDEEELKWGGFDDDDSSDSTDVIITADKKVEMKKLIARRKSLTKEMEAISKTFEEYVNIAFPLLDEIDRILGQGNYQGVKPKEGAKEKLPDLFKQINKVVAKYKVISKMNEKI